MVGRSVVVVVGARSSEDLVSIITTRVVPGAEGVAEAFSFPPPGVAVKSAPGGFHISRFTAPTSSVSYRRFHVTIAERKGTPSEYAER